MLKTLDKSRKTVFLHVDKRVKICYNTTVK